MKKIVYNLLLSSCVSLFANELADTHMSSESPNIQHTEKPVQIKSSPKKNTQQTETCTAEKADTCQKSATIQTPASTPQKIKISEHKSNHEKWKPFLQSCLTSILTGAAIGTLSGQASAYTVQHQCNFDSRIKRWTATAISWFLWSAARQAVIEVLEGEMDNYRIKHNKTLMEVTGYCSDWMSYVYAMYKIYE